MEANNSEIDAQVDETSTGTIPEASAVEVEQSTDVESVESVEGEVESNIESEESEELVYQLGDKEITLARLEELEKGSMLQADYTKKSQANAETKKELDSRLAQASEKVENLEAQVAQLDQLLASEDAEVDWEYVRDTNPSEYLKLKEDHKLKVETVNKAKADIKALKDAEFNDKVARESQALIDALPEWSNAEVQAKDAKAISDYLESNSFTEDDTSDLVNHKVYLAIHKAAKYDALMSKTEGTKKAVQLAPKTVKASVKQKAQPKTRLERFYGTK